MGDTLTRRFFELRGDMFKLDHEARKANTKLGRIREIADRQGYTDILKELDA